MGELNDKDKKWYRLSDASRLLGRERSYISAWLHRHEGVLPDDMLFQDVTGQVKLISLSGVEWLENYTKKTDVHTNTVIVGADKYPDMRNLGNVLV